MIWFRWTVLSLVLMAGSALAHNGVKNPAVMARMENMSTMKDAIKSLSAMANGKTAFSVGEVDAQMDILRRQAAEIEAYFEAREDDPKSEAKPVIWENWADFQDKAAALETVLASTEIDGFDGLAPALTDLGLACKACHDLYKD